MIKKGGEYVHGNGNNSYRSRCPWSYDGTQKWYGINKDSRCKEMIMGAIPTAAQ